MEHHDTLLLVVQKLTKIEIAVEALLQQAKAKEWYTVEEFAQIVNRANFTCREWARLGRIQGQKRESGRGNAAEWVISHQELLRYQRDGLLPLDPAPSLRRGAG